MWFTGLLNISWIGCITYTLILTHITMVSVSIYLHRTEAHRSLTLHPIISHFFRFWLYLTTGMKTIEWVAIHRKHHAKSDTTEDPHSPQIYGIKTLLLEGADLYRSAKREPGLLEKYGKNTPNDWIEKNVYQVKFLDGKLGIFLMLFLNIVLLGFFRGIMIWSIQMMWTPFFAAGIINGIGHWWGYRNFECADTSTNIFPLGILIAGEELHNNHHAYGKSAKFSNKWWEFDIGWMYIIFMKFLGLAKIKRLYPIEIISKEKKEVDFETLKAILTNRIQVISRYKKQVIKPLFYNHNYINLTLKDYNLICRHEILTSNKEKEYIKSVLSIHKELETLIFFREKLKKLWSKTTVSHKELLDDLKEWIKKAEESGLKSLQEFAFFVKSYTIHNPLF